MLISRRSFLKIFVVAASSVAVAYMVVQSLPAWLLTPIRVLHRRLMFPVLEDAPTGVLNPLTLRVLLAMTETLTGTRVELSHYEDFFRWHAENRRGYKALYERFAVTLDQSARQAAGCNFVGCNENIRRKILEKASQVGSTTGIYGKVRRRVLARDWVLFDQYIIRSILLVFARTDAWVLLGYESWPGTPRGLDRYTYPPS